MLQLSVSRANSLAKDGAARFNRINPKNEGKWLKQLLNVGSASNQSKLS